MPLLLFGRGSFEFQTLAPNCSLGYMSKSHRSRTSELNRFSDSPNPGLAMKNEGKKRNRVTNSKKKRQLGVKEGEEEAEKRAIDDIEDLFSGEETQKIRASLLEWYDKNRRDLPWRRTKGDGIEGGGGEEKERRAYGVWVSEVMLQQTRVQTVIDYYNRWMQRWPTLQDLAQASLEEVNEMWAGLGYYRRARFLLEGTKMIVSGWSEFPCTVSALRKVPGIGDYTAGAIASIAFNEVVPVVDGNVIRVLARLKAISENPKDKLTIKNFWKLAAQLVDPSQPGDFNQSLMELGATLCTPLNPSCSSCPVSDQCRAFSVSKHDDSVKVTDYPMKVLKPKQRCDFSTVSVVEIFGGQDISKQNQSDSKFLLIKRPDAGLLAGLWEFPSVTLDEEPDLPVRRKNIDLLLKKSFKLNPPKNCSIISREYVGEFFHAFTHIRRKIYVELLVLRLNEQMHDLFREQDKENMPWKCVDGEALSSMGLTSAVRKVYSMVEKFKHKSLSAESMPLRKRANLKRECS
ncbi:hypothetical protein SLEP1_g10888 [Rubroshorea leprosula]|uniref:Adenine DNA glycosylase n=1 Tax=Rubroshorea leprosula TaxID=152421 RepID=A0AAV5IJI7_9ROSI|nr:hypothetical protein SLEP1_g10888 [Rubroshorea leprosula]